MFTNGENLSAEELRSLLHYDPQTGEFTWSSTPRKGVRSGCPAGHKAAYHRIRIHRVEYKAQRLAWLYVNGSWPNGVIDHINGNPLDNRIGNLRVGSQSENLANRPKQRNNTTGFKGVSKLKGQKFWRATLRGKHIGLFRSPEEASEAYRVAAEKAYGVFANWSTDHELNVNISGI